MRKPVLILLYLLVAAATLAMETREAVFAVDCYDVGKEALQGVPGVVSVENQWQRFDGYKFREINRVRYDPLQISSEELAERLRRVHTYRYTVDGDQEPQGQSR